MHFTALQKRRGRQSQKSGVLSGIVEPGRPISKAELEARKDSVINGYEEQQEKASDPPEHTFWSAIPQLEDYPECMRRKWTKYQDITLSVIFFLLVFGALYSLVEYLLSSTRATAQQCTPTTVYLPVIETVSSTQYLPAPNSSVAAPIASSVSPPASLTTVLTTTVPYTQTITVLASIASPSADPSAEQSSGPPPLSYMVSSGTTHWIGASPASGASIVFASTIATVTIMPSVVPEVTSHTTITSTVVVTKSTTITLSSSAASSSSSTVVPGSIVDPDGASSQMIPTATVLPFTFTVFSIANPDSTTTLTRTLTTTVSLSRVTPHSSFAGVKTNGWNATSAIEHAQSAEPTTRTFSELYYFGAGNATTSTSTALITTTIGATITQTFVPTPFVASISGGLTTITGTPATITYTVQAESTAASVSIPDVTASPGSSSVVSSGLIDPTFAAPSGLSSAIILSSSPVASPVTEASQPSSAFSAPPSSHAVGPIYSNTSSSVPDQATVPSPITVTSFISGHGTTLTVMDTAVGSATPVSSSHDSILPSPSTWTVAGLTSIGPVPPPEPSGSSSPETSSKLSSATATVAGTKSGDSSSVPIIHGTTITLEDSSITSANSVSSATGASSPLQTSTASGGSPASSPPTDKPASSSATYTSSSSVSNPFPASSATAIPSRGCGEQGDFTMNFDDLPIYSPTKRQWNQTNGTDITQYPPMAQRPYHHMYFSGGYVYAPSAAEPFAPASSPNVAAFVEPNKLTSRPGSSPNMTEPGEIGDQPHADNDPALWFDPRSVYLGCDNDGPDDCTIETTGYRYDPQANDELPGPQINFTLGPCIGYKNCKLQRFDFPDHFNNLSGIQFRAFVDNSPRMYFVDNLNMRWSNTSCQAGMQRMKTP